MIGRGKVNHVFVAKPWVVRFPRDPLDDGGYLKEAWCLKSVDVRTPDLVAVGTTGGVPWIVQTFVEGQVGNETLWGALGELSRRIAQADLHDAPDDLFPRFGRDLALNWEEHVRYNLEQLGPGDPLLALGAYADAMPLIESFERLRELCRFGLSHGDLVPANTLTRSSTVTILDWGSATTGPVPHMDLLRVLNDPATKPYAARFAEGAGVELANLHEQLEDLRLLQAVDLARWARDRCVERAAEYLEQARSVVAQHGQSSAFDAR